MPGQARSSRSTRKRTAEAAAVQDAEEAQPSGEQAQASQANPWIREDDPELQHILEQMDCYETDARTAVEETRSSLSATEQDKLVREVMRLMMFRQETKPNVPVPRGDLNKLFPANRKAFSAMVVRLAQARFADLLGLEMKEVRIAAGKSGGESEGAKYYMLRSFLPAVVRVQFLPPLTTERIAAGAFELTVLALIVMNGERIGEDDLWRLLEDVGIEKGKAHPSLGGPDDKLKQMVTKKYLKMNKGRDANIAYEWGANADDELTRSKVEEYIKETFADQAVDVS